MGIKLVRVIFEFLICFLNRQPVQSQKEEWKEKKIVVKIESLYFKAEVDHEIKK